MKTRRYVVAPVFPKEVVGALPLPVDVGNGVRLDHVPEIFRTHCKMISAEVGARYSDVSSNVALVTDYEAASKNEADPNPPGRRRRKRDAARQAIQVASVSLWLSRPSKLSYRLIAHLEEESEPEAIVFPSLVLLRNFKPVILSRADIADATEINEALCQMNPTLTAFVASRYLWFAIHEEMLDVSFGILSIAIEALVGPENRKDLGRRIPRRGAALLGGDRREQCVTYVRLVEWWDARNELMHGDTMEAHDDATKERLLGDALEFVRQVVRKILLDRAVGLEFASFVRRETYLNQITHPFVTPSQHELDAAQAAR